MVRALYGQGDLQPEQQARDAGRDHQQKGGPRKEKEEAAAGHQLLFLVEPGHSGMRRVAIKPRSNLTM